ncbi:MAG TPA: carboxypeptidase regulatory-like domain-containing protein [Pyrinomonadaceae bacterium]|nr:carboxypeptidase regulatory-like domain-containing protein [Pyrinomonadaceae bacterium]
MRKRTRSVTPLLVLLATLTVSMIVAHSAGGGIEGKVTDPKGAAVAGASVTITTEGNPQRFTGVTDHEGHYKVEGLPAGTYTVVISAPGFNDARKEAVAVEDGATVPLNLRLEIAPVEANVSVVGAGNKANADPVYQQLRLQGKSAQDFSGAYATVNNLTLKKEGAAFNLRSGEIYFLTPVEGRYTGAVFFGDGEFSLVPPTQNEKNSLKLFTNEPAITEQFSSLVMRFTDKTFDEVKNSPAVTMGNSGPQASKASDQFRDNQTLLRKELRDNSELRVLGDLYAPERPGFFTAFINGKRFSKLVYLFNPLGIPEVSPEEVLLFSYGETDGGFWTAFHRLDEYAKGTASSSEDHRLIDLTKHDIEGTIKGVHITATDRLTFRALVPGRVVPLSLFGSLRVSSVQDEQGKELNFIQEAKDQDSDLGIIMPQSLEVGKTYSLTIKYDGGDALRDSGGGNFILIPRSTWYPNNGGSQFGDRAIFEITFRYPKGMTFVGTGAPTAPDSREGDLAVAHWSSGTTELAVAGFNYGKFKKKEFADPESGYNIEFYANEVIPDELRQVQLAIERAEAAGINTMTTLGSISTTAMADSAIGDAQNATRIYNLYFGKLPYTRLAMTQQPAFNFGQAWPTLVFMPYTAFMDSTQRSQLLGVSGGTDNFWRYVAPHEIAHQWWGHIVGWNSYRDQWMSEGFAEFSASLYVWYVRKDVNKFIDFWEDKRSQIVEARPATKGRKPYTVGPVTQGYRLNSGKTGGAYQFLVYPKGAYILHMIRMMMYDQRSGDAKFQAMMKDFVQTHFNKDVSTEDFKSIIEKHITPAMNVDHTGKMDWFFNEYVYGTEMPSYRFDYQVNSDNSISGKITQSGVSNDFVMLVPLYVDLGKGWIRLGAATLLGNSSVDITNIKLPSAPKKVTICALNDVLAASIQSGK